MDSIKKPRAPRRSRGSLSREEILTAAHEVLRQEGLGSLSMRRIAERVGCSVASPYAHFKSQEEIIRSLMIMGEQTLTTDLKRAEASSHDVYDQLEAIARAYWDFARENRELHKLMFNMGDGMLYSKIFNRMPTSYRVFLSAIRRGVITGAMPYSRRKYLAIARTLWSWIFGAIVLDMTGMVKKGEDPIQEGIVLFKSWLQRGE